MWYSQSGTTNGCDILILILILILLSVTDDTYLTPANSIAAHGRVYGHLAKLKYAKYSYLRTVYV